ncbi:MAG: putative large terminase subunit [Cryophage ML09]|nr:MAG: putative large terminase subunit [Cryophage ML09]
MDIELLYPDDLTYLKAVENYLPIRLVGEHEIIMPELPERSMILNVDIHKTLQKWTRPEFPKAMWKMSSDKIYDSGNEEYIAILQREYERIYNGVFFMNNGNIEYLTGANYFFLTYWDLNGLYPHFIDEQQSYFLLALKGDNDPNIGGVCIVANRRSGKTEVAMCKVYHRTITHKNHYTGIQSKKSDDAKGIFIKIVKRWRKMPSFIRPIDNGFSDPRTELSFTAPATKSVKKEDNQHEQVVLESKIDYRSSTVNAYDGEELNDYLVDEFGKCEEVDVQERHRVHKYCLTKGSTIQGKAFYITTVEEMTRGGGKMAKELWDECSLLTMVFGRTKSLMIRYFSSAAKGYQGFHPITKEFFIDEYGYSKIDFATNYILSGWEGLPENLLIAEQQKNPLTEAHAFSMATSNSQLPLDIVLKVKEELEIRNITDPASKPRRVDFYRELDGTVKWRDNAKHGKFHVLWDFQYPAEANKSGVAGGHTIPVNTHRFSIGVDPFGSNMTVGKGSNGCIYVFMKYNDKDPENSCKPIVRYCYRQREKDMMHEDVLMLCEYFSCEANYESDFDDFYEYFKYQGRLKFIMRRPEFTKDKNKKNRNEGKWYGTPSKDPFALNAQLKVLITYIIHHCYKIEFMELLDDFLEYDHYERTPFDDTVAFQMCLLGGIDAPTPKNVKVDAKKPQLMKVYNLHKTFGLH